ncbi:hypothetical protein SteCoe_16857 [Stentor coeruleus]|uniref:Uncharacterized protein n=1 Tax=Stentor coeruleus TaxID=5963 RepID=A0A1R2C0A5_9CILI|nr:hypothetical protein SteCoe_16857 [Stentor coeruleus]
MHFRTRPGKISPIRLRAQGHKLTHSELSIEKPTESISTADSSRLKKTCPELENINIIKTPTTVHDEPLCLENLDEYLNMYFNCRNNTLESKPVVSKDIKLSHRYTLTQKMKKITPQRSETPEIPTRPDKKPLQIAEKLPAIEKKPKKRLKKSQSPKNYTINLRTKSNIRAQSPLSIIKIRY